jgi:hypothetical protein
MCDVPASELRKEVLTGTGVFGICHSYSVPPRSLTSGRASNGTGRSALRYCLPISTISIWIYCVFLTMDHPISMQDSDDRYPRSTSVPPPSRPFPSIPGRGASNSPTPSSMSKRKTTGSFSSTTDKEDESATTLDLMSHLQRSGPSIVKTRTGSVLSRGFILKTDYYPSGTSRRHSLSAFVH